MSTPHEFLDPKIILDRFGGVAGMAEAVDRPPSTIRNWAADGIPPLWHSRLLVLAREREIELSADELLATINRK